MALENAFNFCTTSDNITVQDLSEYLDVTEKNCQK